MWFRNELSSLAEVSLYLGSQLFTLAMTNKLVVIINSLKVPKIKKILLYEVKFLVPNYNCLQNPWLGGYHPQIPVLSVLNWICWTPSKQNSWVHLWCHWVSSPQNFKGSLCLHLRLDQLWPWRWRQWSFATLATTHPPTWHFIPEDLHFQPKEISNIRYS